MTGKRDLLKGAAGLLILSPANVGAQEVVSGAKVLGSIEELRNTAVDSNSVFVKSYYKNNDSLGGGVFYWIDRSSRGSRQKYVDQETRPFENSKIGEELNLLCLVQFPRLLGVHRRPINCASKASKAPPL